MKKWKSEYIQDYQCHPFHQRKGGFVVHGEQKKEIFEKIIYLFSFENVGGGNSITTIITRQ